MLAAGRRVLMLVPEIALTPAVAALFRQAFGDRVAIQHSGLSDGERHDQWQRIRRGDVDGRRRHPVGGLCAARPHRPDRRRRGARQLVQAGREPALQRPRRRDRPGAARGRPGRARLGDAVDGDLPQCDGRPVRAHRAAAPDPRPAARCRVGRRHARGVRAWRARTSCSAGRSSTRIEERLAQRRAVAAAAEPPGIRDVGVLPAVRRDHRLSELQRLARRARRRQRAPGALSLLQLHGARADEMRRCARPRTSSRPASAPSASKRRSGGSARRRASRAWIATRCGERGR